MRGVLRLVTFAVAVACMLTAAAAADDAGATAPPELPPPRVIIKPAGPFEVVFDHKTDACEPDDVPDDGARAFRDASGRVHLVASGYENFAMVGASLDSVKRVCRSIYQDGRSADPGRFDDWGWLESVYTLDGKTIHALVSHDYHPQRHGLPCGAAPGSIDSCWYSDVLQATSTDGGDRFVSPPPGGARLVAGAPYRYSADHPAAVGAFVVSNIISRDGAYYVFVSVAGDGAQTGGDCLLRTETLGVANSWRAWDGRAFTVDFIDPYETPVFDPAKHVCAPVAHAQLGYAVRSLLALAGGRGYVVTMEGAVNEPSGAHVPVTLSSASADLIHWSPPAIVAAFEPHAPACTATSPHTLMYEYPALLDSKSPTPSFETIGDRAYVYYVRVRRCGGLDRDLVRLPVTIETQ